MSLKSWSAEFYPVEASAVHESEAAEHSLRKWIGLRKENLERHGCSFGGLCAVFESSHGDALVIAAGSCALCVHYEDDGTECETCPLAEHLGKRCDDGTEENRSPYGLGIHGNPEPMIAALEAVVAKQKAAASERLCDRSR